MEQSSVVSHSYSNEDLAIVPPSQRTWGVWNFVALWIGMSFCIPTYMMASSLIEGGMNWWQSILTIFLGNCIVLVPMVLNGHAGTKYGISFPVFARSSFGIRGANIPAVLRAIVACGWFGIQTWIGGHALYQLCAAWLPGIKEWPSVFPAWLGLETGPAVAFFVFWLINMYVIHKGIESIRKLLQFKAIILPVFALALLWWAWSAAQGFGPLFSRPDQFATSGEFWYFFFPALTGIIGFWATVSLNIPDFTRYSKTQKAQVLGQTLALPTSMASFAFVGVMATSATAIVFGDTIWDPVALAGRFTSPLIVTFAMFAVILSTLATNIAANIVSPANDFSNLAPHIIDFRMGGYITAVVGVLICPWKLVSDPSGYIFTWLIAYSSLLGPIGGVMIADYYFVRKRVLFPEELYEKGSRYWFRSGFNMTAMVALVLGIIPNVPGFLATMGVEAMKGLPVWVVDLYHFAWFVGFLVSAVAYLLITALKGNAGHVRSSI